MTRIEQALHWWARADEDPVPPRHYEVLSRNDCVEIDDYDGCAKLTPKGRTEMRRLGYEEERPGSNIWKHKRGRRG